jgi:hypothetical protein
MGFGTDISKYRINCEITTGGRRALVLRAGKTYRYLIAEQELL